MSEAHPCREELDLLLELATGAKTFEQVRKDALKSFFPGAELKKAVQSNASRGATSRLADLTGISENTLHHFPVRCKLESATEGNKMMHPFVLVSTMLVKFLQKDDFFFRIAASSAGGLHSGIIFHKFTSLPGTSFSQRAARHWGDSFAL